jgi:hypothetical protein
LAQLKEELWAEADEAKSAVVEKASSSIHRVVAGLKEKAAANPLAAAAIGAGVAWRLVHRPPIASLLVGAGLYSLLRTTPSHDGSGSGIPPQARALSGEVRERLVKLSESTRRKMAHAADQASTTAQRASSAAQDAAQSARETVGSLAQDVSAAADHAIAATQERVAQLRESASAAGRETSRLLHEAIPGEQARDGVLLGAAALAVATALGIAWQRKVQREEMGAK